MRCLVLEQREYARLQLERQLGQFADVECIAYRDTASAPDAWPEQSPDVIFFGNDLPQLEPLLESLTSRSRHAPVTVMTGDLPIHALAAFDLQVTDFLLRPVETARLEECMRRIRTELGRRRDLARVGTLSETLAEIRRGHASADSGALYRDFWIRSRNETVRVPQSKIVWIEAARGYVYFNLAQRRLLHRISLLELESRLDPAHFLRVHRSAIVNVHCIERTHSNRHGTYALDVTIGDRVRIGRKYRVRLAEYMAGEKVSSLAAA